MQAFASQFTYCAKKHDINKDLINVNGDALALGHSLGATGYFSLLWSNCDSYKVEKSDHVLHEWFYENEGQAPDATFLMTSTIQSA